MNFVNRVIVTVLLVAIVVLLVPIAVTPQGIAEFFAFQLGQVQVSPLSLTHLFIALASLAGVIVCLLLLSFEWRRTKPVSVPLTRSGSHSTELATASVAERLRQDIALVSQVRQVLPAIHTRGKVVDIQLEVRTTADVDVPTKAAEIDKVARESVDRLGLKLNKLRVKIVCVPGTTTEQPASPS